MQRLAKRLKQLQREEEKLQADRTVTAEQMAKRGSAALLQEKYRQERETLENLLRGWEQACQELEEKQSAYRDGIWKRDDLRKNYQAMESLFLDAQARFITHSLQNGRSIRRTKRRWIRKRKNCGRRKKQRQDRAKRPETAADG